MRAVLRLLKVPSFLVQVGSFYSPRRNNEEYEKVQKKCALPEESESSAKGDDKLSAVKGSSDSKHPSCGEL